MTTRCSTPICGAARPAPLFAAIVSIMSSRSAFSSGVPNASTGLERSRRTGCPILSTSRTGMALHHSGHDQPHASHALVHNAPDVVEGHGARAGAAPRLGVHDHGE